MSNLLAQKVPSSVGHPQRVWGVASYLHRGVSSFPSRGYDSVILGGRPGTVFYVLALFCTFLLLCRISNEGLWG
jgi:hypothetical protein